MATAAYITRTLDPLVSPKWVKQDAAYEKGFEKLVENEHSSKFGKDYIRGFRRNQAACMDWAGDHVLVATNREDLFMYDARGSEVRNWGGDWHSLQCHPSDPNIAACVEGSGGRFRVIDVRESKKYIYDVDLSKISNNMHSFFNVVWSPEGHHVALNNVKEELFTLDLRGSLRLSGYLALAAETPINAIGWSAPTKALWVGDAAGKLDVIAAPELKRCAAVQAHSSSITALATDGAGTCVAAASSDCLVSLWDPAHMVCVNTYGYATQSPQTLSFNHDCSLLAWGTGSAGSNSGGEKNLTIVGTNTGVMYWQDTTSAPVHTVRFHRQKNWLAYALNAHQVPVEDRDRRGTNRETATLHLLQLPPDM
mmetsp:Transcript_22933/g.52573  ORF Transcript_22933/g.52573 Transcript_22933/m.52573 type:complete len:366 (+) Transcript_22933:50-1147(+)